MTAGNELERLTALFGSGTDRVDSPSGLFVPDERVVYAAGTTLPLIGARPPQLQLDPRSLRLPESEPAHFAYMGTYLTTREYVPEEDLPHGKESDSLQRFADSERRANLIRSLAVVNEISKRASGYADLAADYRSGMSEALAERFDAAMLADTSGLGRMVVGPQPLLLSMRWLLGRRPASEPIDAAAKEVTGRRAILFSHLVGATLHGTGDHKTDLSLEDRKRLMLVLMNIGTLGERGDVYASVDRTVRLWRDYGQLAVGRLDRTAAELFFQFTGTDVLDFLGVGFALLAHVLGWQPGQPFLLNRQIHEDAPHSVVDRVLGFIGQKVEHSLETLGEPRSEFDFLAIEDRPVVIEDDGLLVLDQDLLWRRCTSGLYWFVHNGLKTNEGESARHLWTMAYGDMIEAFAEDSLRPLAPPVLGRADKTFYTEDDFEVAYGQIARCDAGIDFGDRFLLAEVVSGQLTVVARVEGDLDKLEADFDKLVFRKCEQLNSTALSILADEEPLTGVAKGQRNPLIVPALVVGGGFSLNHLTYSYIRWTLAQRELLAHPKIAPLAVLDLEDVEILEALGENGHSPADVLVDWQASDLADLSLHNFLMRSGLIGNPPTRPSRMRNTVDDTFREVIGRLGFTQTEDTPGATA